MISVDDALGRVLGLVAALPGEVVPLRDALHRHPLAPVDARITQPPFDASAMDGYAIAGPAQPGATFRIVGQAAAGHGFSGLLGAGEALRIFTGAPLPAGATRVVIQEDTSRDGDTLTIGANPDAATHIRPRGQDFAEGSTRRFTRLGPADIGLLAAMNLSEIAVHRSPVVAILSTGDELVPPGATPGPDQIINSSAHALAALVQAEGGVARLLPIARDTVESLQTALSLTAGADLIVTLGGASVGEHDLLGKRAIDLGLTLDFWKIALRPGKPMLAGRYGSTPLLGLPGNPVSAYVCAVLFMLPMLRALQGQTNPAPEIALAPTATALGPNGPRRHFMRATLSQGQIRALPHQDSALTSVLAEAEALLIRPETDPAREIGALVPYILLPR